MRSASVIFEQITSRLPLRSSSVLHAPAVESRVPSPIDMLHINLETYLLGILLAAVQR
ncbi:hypothetical protein H9P43_007586 [Blastocladiella emersonii ATCC 22665]|nr:hypothetical protein H9P43_007586 [Blastocladiella emersonii ATCC 22665]